MIFQRKSIFDVVREAEEDETSSDDTADTSSDNTEDTSSSTDDSTESTDDSGSDDNDQSDDFDIDTDLDNDGSSDEGDNDNADDNSDISYDNSSSSGIGDSGDEEPVKANTDIFASLTAEEQATKIKELKKMYEDLYISCDDFQRKLGEVDSEQNPDVYERLSVVIYKLKNYISDYLLNKFPQASYIENDVSFNRFLSILKTLSNVLQNLLKDQYNQRNGSN